MKNDLEDEFLLALCTILLSMLQIVPLSRLYDVLLAFLAKFLNEKRVGWRVFPFFFWRKERKVKKSILL